MKGNLKESTMSSIPEEIYHEILLRIPVKSTFVCKCVSKTWLALISDADFVKSHLNLAIQKKNTHLMLTGGFATAWGNRIYSIPHDSLLSSIQTYEFHVNPVELKPPLQSSFDSNVGLLSSCNGLVCLSCYHNLRKVYCLWNPATTEFKEIPKSPDEVDCGIPMAIAFGYDSKAEDYKLLQVICSFGENHVSLVQVYTLGSNSWESILTIPYYFSRAEYPGVLVNGVFHWLGKARDKQLPELIVTLDLGEVKFKELQLPKEALEKKYSFIDLGELEGCLCVFVYVNKICFEVWVMQEYGVPESWTKRYVVDCESAMPYVWVRLMHSFRSGEILFGICGHDRVLYDPEYGSVRELSISGLESLHQVVNYFESLVTLNSGTYVGRTAEGKGRLLESWW